MNAAHAKASRATATVLQLACALAIPALAAPLPNPLIETARAAAAAYQNSLHDYIAKRTTARYRGTRAALWQPASAVRVWNQADRVTGDVTAVHGKEVYSNITINGMPAAELPNWGSWSAGEFATALLAILPPERAAALTHQHAEQLRNRAAARYDFAVDQSHSAWRQVLRIENVRARPAGLVRAQLPRIQHRFRFRTDRRSKLSAFRSARQRHPKGLQRSRLAGAAEVQKGEYRRFANSI